MSKQVIVHKRAMPMDKINLQLYQLYQHKNMISCTSTTVKSNHPSWGKEVLEAKKLVAGCNPTRKKKSNWCDHNHLSSPCHLIGCTSLVHCLHGEPHAIKHGHVLLCAMLIFTYINTCIHIQYTMLAKKLWFCFDISWNLYWIVYYTKKEEEKSCFWRVNHEFACFKETHLYQLEIQMCFSFYLINVKDRKLVCKPPSLSQHFIMLF